MPGRTIAIGDIHGCGQALSGLLQAIQPTHADTLITLGDYVDRGPDSAGVLEQLVELISCCEVIPLLGNHELMMIQAMRDPAQLEFWLGCGGDATLASYGGHIRNVPQHHRMFLQHCVHYHETDTHLFVHANYHPDQPLEHQPSELLFWQHITRTIPPPHYSGKTVMVGHTPQEDGEVKDYGHLVLLDTFCFGGKWLSAIDVQTGQLWQVDNHGGVRSTEASS